MFKKVFALIIVIVIASTVAKSQNNCSCKNIIEKIDSISKVTGIYTGEVLMNEVTTSLNKTATNPWHISEIGKFKFDGQFLVIENKYFNINKLLYFEIKKKKFSFFLQAY